MIPNENRKPKKAKKKKENRKDGDPVVRTVIGRGCMFDVGCDLRRILEYRISEPREVN
jgi:hypothetical protein